MIDQVIAYWNSLSTGQKVTAIALAGSASTLMGSAVAYKFVPQFAEIIDDNRQAAMIVTAVLAAPILLPLASSVLSQASSAVEGIVPDFMKLPAPAMAGIHMNGLAMGALAMRNNPLALRNNPIAMNGISMGAIHAMNGLHI